LAAALGEFAERGFAATRLDDVARRADVAKGTIYLHFADKEALFEELIRMELSPVVAALENVSHADIPFRAMTGQLIEAFAREIFETRRGRHPLGHYRRSALSQACRILLPRSDLAGDGDDPRHAAPSPRAR
jgi:AcrR family transcriptional regulator